MHRPFVRLFVACAVTCLAFGTAGATLAELDTPDLAPGISGVSLVHLDVTAGASGAPNGFTIDWMTRAQFDALGGWPADPADPAIRSAIYLGYPTLNTVDGTRTFLLGPGAGAAVEIGDIFDETGVVSDNRAEMSQGTEYVFRVKANGDPGVGGGGGSLLPESQYSPTQSAWTKAHDDLHDCVHTQGYWKNHPAAWPVSTVKLGLIIYTKPQLLDIFNEPADGNGLISLAHQLIAAKLNLAAGAVAPSSILGAISTADGLIGAKIVPPIGTGYIEPSVSSHLTDDLEEFNSSELDHHDCQGVTSSRARTWGDLKAMYR